MHFRWVLTAGLHPNSKDGGFCAGAPHWGDQLPTNTVFLGVLVMDRMLFCSEDLFFRWRELFPDHLPSTLLCGL